MEHELLAEARRERERDERAVRDALLAHGRAIMAEPPVAGRVRARLPFGIHTDGKPLWIEEVTPEGVGINGQLLGWGALRDCAGHRGPVVASTYSGVLRDAEALLAVQESL